MIQDLDAKAKKAYNQKLKYEVAEELGLMDKVNSKGWGGLSARETGMIGGMVARKKRGQ